MKAWRIVRFGEICDFLGGGTPSRKSPEFYRGSIPWATVKDFKSTVLEDTEEHISESAVDASATRIVPAATVLLVTRVSVGKVAITAVPMAINQDIKAVIPKDRSIEPHFLLWALVAKGPELERMASGSTVKGITLETLREHTLPLPPLSEQRRIVDILNRANGVRRLRRDALEKARQVIPALFVEMFGDPGSNQKGWPLIPFGEVTSFSRYGPRFYNRPYSTSGVRVLRTTDISMDGTVQIDDAPTLSLTAEEIERYSVQPRTLLFTRTGATIGKVTLYRGSSEPVVAGAYLIEFRVKPDVDDGYLWAFFTMPSSQRQLLRHSRTVAQPNINVPAISAIPVPVPPLEQQRAFTERVADLHSIISQQERAAGAADRLVNSLMAQVFAA